MENNGEPKKRRPKKKAPTEANSGGSSYKRISIEMLTDLGYHLTGRQFNIGTKGDNYLVLELKNEDNKKEVTFCYLYSREEGLGVILPDTFSFYMNYYGK